MAFWPEEKLPSMKHNLACCALSNERARSAERRYFTMTEQANAVTRVDTKRLLGSLWRKSWIVGIVAVVSAVVILCGSLLFITPRYTASAMLYVSNSSISISSGFSISSSDLTAAQSLVRTYLVVLNSNSTLETVIREAGVTYNCEELKEMITAGAVNGTEVFEVSVTSEDPKEAKHIANAIAVVLPGRIASVVEGSTVRVVDYAEEPENCSYPNYVLSTGIAFAAGALLTVFIIVAKELSNRTIRSEEYLTQTYKNIPLLAVIPDTREKGKSSYQGYYDSRRTRQGSQRGGKN